MAIKEKNDCGKNIHTTLGIVNWIESFQSLQPKLDYHYGPLVASLSCRTDLCEPYSPMGGGSLPCGKAPVKITIAGQPLSKLRPRFLSRKHVIDPQSAQKHAIRQRIALQHKNPTDKPLIVKLRFFMNSHSNANQSDTNKKLWGFSAHDMKPDVDNLAKFYLDCGNEILWKDDKQIVGLEIHKSYDINPRTEIEIMEAEEISLQEHEIEFIEKFRPQDIQEFLKDAKVLIGFDPMAEEQISEKAKKLSTFIGLAIAFAEKHSAIIARMKKIEIAGIGKTLC